MNIIIELSRKGLRCAKQNNYYAQFSVCLARQWKLQLYKLHFLTALWLNENNHITTFSKSFNKIGNTPGRDLNKMILKMFVGPEQQVIMKTKKDMI